MANKQSLPTMNETKGSFVNTSAMGNVVAPEYKEQKWSTVARIGEGIVGVSNAFKNMKHTEMMAKLDNLAQQNLHKLGDATDPSQLPDLINEANQSYDDLFKDDPYGKSFYESDLYNTFKLKNDANIEKTVTALNHKFSSIQAIKTGNEISSDIALMSDPERMTKALAMYEKQLDGLELTAEEKFKIMTDVTKDSFGKVFTNSPNNAVAWFDYSNGAYNKYGIDGAEIKEKAKQKDLQQFKLEQYYKNQKIKEEDREKKQKKEAAEKRAYDTVLSYKLGNKTAEEVKLEAEALNSEGYSKEAFTLLSKAFPESKQETQKQITINNIGTRINELSNIQDEVLRDAEIELLEMEIEEASNLNLISKDLEKKWKSKLSPEEKNDLDYFLEKAETGSLNGDDENDLDDLVAKEKITDTQRSSVLTKNDRNKNIAQYHNAILKDEITTPEQIDGLEGVNDKQKVTLKEALRKHRTDMGYDNPNVENAYSYLNKGDTKGFFKALKDIPESKRLLLLDKFRDKVQKAQNQNYEKLQVKLADNKLNMNTLEAVYQDRLINFDQYKNLKNESVNRAVKEATTSTAEIYKRIINGEIRTETELDKVYSDVDVNTPNYLINYNALKSLLDEKSKPYYDILNKAFSTIDGFLKKDALGNNTTAAVKNAETAKRQILYIFTQHMQDDRITLDKMREIFSPNNITALAQVYSVDLNDLTESYKNVGASYDKDEFTATFGNMDANSIKQLDATHFIGKPTTENDSEENSSDNKNTIVDSISNWWAKTFSEKENKTPKKESEKISDINTAISDLEDVEIEDGLLKEGL